MYVRTNTTDRKNLVKAIAEFLGKESRYLGPPTFAYAVGGYTVHKDSTITADDDTDGLRAFLIERGYLEEDVDRIDVSVQADPENLNGMQNILFQLHARKYLLNQALGRPWFAIPAALVETLKNNPPENYAAFLALVSENAANISGVEFTDDKVTISLPIFEDTDRNDAFCQLAGRILTSAKKAKWINPNPVEPENEKYYFRIWLLRLGFSGKDYADLRKSLMQTLKGNAAFRTEEDLEKFKENQKTKRIEKRRTAV